MARYLMKFGKMMTLWSRPAPMNKGPSAWVQWNWPVRPNSSHVQLLHTRNPLTLEEMWLRGDYKTETCEFNTLLQARLARLLWTLAPARPSLLGQKPILRVATHYFFAVTHVHVSKATQLTDLVSKQRFGTHVCGVRRGVHFLQCQLPIFQRFLQPQTKTNMLRCNTVASASRVVSDALAVLWQRWHCNWTRDHPAIGDATDFDLLSPSSSITSLSQFCSEGQPVLAPAQLTIEDVEFLLIVRSGPDWCVQSDCSASRPNSPPCRESFSRWSSRWVVSRTEPGMFASAKRS